MLTIWWRGGTVMDEGGAYESGLDGERERDEPEEGRGLRSTF